MGFERIHLNAFGTPKSLANAIVKYLNGREYQNILEPCCGNGVFLDALADNGVLKKALSVTVVDIDSDACENISERYSSYPKLSVLCKNFFSFYNEAHQVNKYDLIVGSLPAIRYINLTDNEKASLSRTLTTHGLSENKLLNEWVGYLVNCVSLLSESGRLAFVLPGELLCESFTEQIRGYLARHLEYVTIISFQKKVASSLDHGAVVFVSENRLPQQSMESIVEDKCVDSHLGSVRAIEFSDIKEFKQFDFSGLGFRRFQFSQEKWAKYFVSKSDNDIIDDLRNSTRFVTFGKHMDVRAGIATGCNDFFSVTAEWRGKYDLSDVTFPLLGHIDAAPGILYTAEDWNNSVQSGDKSFLLCFPDNPDGKRTEGQETYIEFGVLSGKSRNLKCGIRDTWYVVSSFKAPGAFLTRRTGDYPRMILNECGAVCTDELLQIGFHDDTDPKDILLLFYSTLTFVSIEMLDCMYSGSALLPGEAGQAMIPMMPACGMDVEVRNRLCNQVDAMMRGGEKIDSVLDLVDKEVLIKIIGIDEKVCLRCRDIWKALRARRLNRKAKRYLR